MKRGEYVGVINEFRNRFSEIIGGYDALRYYIKSANDFFPDISIKGLSFFGRRFKADKTGKS